MPDKKPKISNWKELWNNLDYGPKGSFIALILILIVLLTPLALQLLFYIILIILCMVAGGLIGTLIGLIIQNYKKSKKK